MRSCAFLASVCFATFTVGCLERPGCAELLQCAPDGVASDGGSMVDATFVREKDAAGETKPGEQSSAIPSSSQLNLDAGRQPVDAAESSIGAECDGGRCDASVSVLTNGCVESCFGGTCDLTVFDQDGDGHAAVGNDCEAAPTFPRDDCDDTDPNATPDGIEVCDGIDNDCNGLADFADGLLLGGSPLEVSDDYGYSDGAWWRALENWVVAVSTPSHVAVALLEPNGSVSHSPQTLAEGEGDYSLFRPQVAIKGETLGLLWSVKADGTKTDWFRRFELGPDQTLVPIGEAVEIPTIASYSELAQSESGGWAILSSEGPRVVRLDAKGLLLGEPEILGNASYKASIGSGDAAVAAWFASAQSESGDFGGFEVLTASWGGPAMERESEPRVLAPGRPDEPYWGTTSVSGIADGTLVAARRNSNGELSIARLGTGECGPVVVPDAPRPKGVDGELFITGNTRTALYLTEDSHVHLLSARCETSTKGTVSAPLGGTPSADFYSLSSYEGGHLIVWAQNEPKMLMARAMGATLCGAPSGELSP